MRKLQQFGFSGLFFVGLFLVSSFVLFYPSARHWLADIFARPERKILSVVSGRIFPDNKIGKVIKLQTQRGIEVEIYSTSIEGPDELVDTLVFEGHREAQVQFLARATNLGLKDETGDNIFEIIIPTLDRNLKPLVSRYTYNPDSQHFTQLSH